MGCMTFFVWTGFWNGMVRMHMPLMLDTSTAPGPQKNRGQLRVIAFWKVLSKTEPQSVLGKQIGGPGQKPPRPATKFSGLQRWPWVSARSAPWFRAQIQKGESGHRPHIRLRLQESRDYAECDEGALALRDIAPSRIATPIKRHSQG